MSLYSKSLYSLPYFEIQQQSDSRIYNPLHSDFGQQNRSQGVIPLTEKNNNKSVRYDDQKSFMNKLDLSQTFQPANKGGQKHPIVVKTHKSLLPDMIKMKRRNGFNCYRKQLTVFYFNTNKWIQFRREELNKKFVLDGRADPPGRQQPLIKYLIRHFVKQYCLQFLNFDPLQVSDQYFQLKLADLNNSDDQLVFPFSRQDQIESLFQCSTLMLLRRQKDYERLRVWQSKIAPQMEVLQIIIPFQKQIIQQVDKSKPLNYLKQKIVSNNQIGNNIAIVTYSNFIVCDFKKKIGDIIQNDRVLQVYRLQTKGFQDAQISKQRQLIDNYKDEPILTSKQSRTITDLQFQVSQNFYSGKLYIQILGTKIIEKYEGGFLSYIMTNQRRVERSIHTLVGISCQNKNIRLKFLTKSGPQIYSYIFQSKNQVQAFFKCLLKIGRQLKQNFQKITK